MRIRMMLAVTAGLLLLSAAAFALPPYGNIFKELYAPKEGTALAKAACMTCHAGSAPTKAMNPYGADLAKQATKDAAALKAIEQLDSDKDGFTNIQEIQAGTLPGDPASTPGK